MALLVRAWLASRGVRGVLRPPKSFGECDRVTPQGVILETSPLISSKTLHRFISLRAVAVLQKPGLKIPSIDPPKCFFFKVSIM